MSLCLIRLLIGEFGIFTYAIENITSRKGSLFALQQSPQRQDTQF